MVKIDTMRIPPTRDIDDALQNLEEFTNEKLENEDSVLGLRNDLIKFVYNSLASERAIEQRLELIEEMGKLVEKGQELKERQERRKKEVKKEYGVDEVEWQDEGSTIVFKKDGTEYTSYHPPDDLTVGSEIVDYEDHEDAYEFIREYWGIFDKSYADIKSFIEKKTDFEICDEMRGWFVLQYPVVSYDFEVDVRYYPTELDHFEVRVSSFEETLGKPSEIVPEVSKTTPGDTE